MAGTFHVLTIDSDGSGDGTGTFTLKASGLVLGARLEYGGTPDAGTDVTITEPNGLKRTLLTASNTGTAATYNPQEEIQDNTGTGVGQYRPFHVNMTNLLVTVADAVVSTSDAVTCVIYLLED